jgi:3-deoxy-D-manno-octulosonic-acid transferase
VYFAYNVLLAMVLLFSAPWWLLEMMRHGKYRAGLGERLGRVPQRLRDVSGRETIWIHAVSVGEVLAISRMVGELKTRLPGWRVVVSTTTDTGQQLARDRFGEQNVFYFPLDFSFAAKAYLRALQPRMLILAESEFWPNLLRLAQKAGVGVAVVNARVSDRSRPRYLRFRALLRPVMRCVEVFVAQSELDAQRLVEIGAPDERVKVGGNLKFEVKPPGKLPIAEDFAAALAREGTGPVIVAGSTLEGEEAMLLDCFRNVCQQYTSAMMVLAPRHPQRFAPVALLLESFGLSWERRSAWAGDRLPAGGVFLLDSIGELSTLYQFADIAFVGGSLVAKGGHNVLEAAQFGVPILVGPHTENFRDIVRIFQQFEALRVVTKETLDSIVLDLLANSEQRKQLGQRAFEVIQTQRGATERTVDDLMRLLSVRGGIHIAETRP